MKRRIPAVALTVCGLLAITAAIGRAEVPTDPVLDDPVLDDPVLDDLVLDDLVFEVGSAEIAPTSRAYLDGIAAMLLAAPETAVELGGHTDSSGPADLNRDLSRRRAESVRRYLARQGVAADRVTAVGYGEGYPIADNTTPEGRAANRRVELKRADS